MRLAHTSLSLLLVLGVAACGDDETTASTQATSTDDTTSTGGQSTGGNNTGGSSDGGGGGTTSASMVVLETITVRAPQDPIAGIDVFTYDAAGKVVETAKTDANGQVKIDVPEGGGVGAVQATSQGNTFANRISTVSGVPDGNDVRIIVLAPPETVLPDNEPMGTITVHAKNTFPIGTTAWSVAASCKSASDFFGTAVATRTATLDDFKGCAGTDKFTVFAYTSDANDKVTSFGKLEDVAFKSGMTASLEIDLAAANLQTVTGTLSNLPAGASYTASSFFTAKSNDVYFQALLSGAAPGATLPLSIALPADSQSGSFFQTVLIFGSATRSLSSSYIGAKALNPEDIDWAAYPSTEVSTLTLDDLAHPKVDWTVVTATEKADASSVTTQWGSQDGTTTWIHVGPPDATSATLPDLPTGFEGFAPTADSMFSSGGVGLIMHGDADDYGAYLALDHGNGIDKPVITASTTRIVK